MSTYKTQLGGLVWRAPDLPMHQYPNSHFQTPTPTPVQLSIPPALKLLAQNSTKLLFFFFFPFFLFSPIIHACLSDLGMLPFFPSQDQILTCKEDPDKPATKHDPPSAWPWFSLNHEPGSTHRPYTMCRRATGSGCTDLSPPLCRMGYTCNPLLHDCSLGVLGNKNDAKGTCPCPQELQVKKNRGGKI